MKCRPYQAHYAVTRALKEGAILHELQQLKQEIEKLSPADQLRLAAGLIEQGKSRLAERIAGNVVDRMRLARYAKGDLL